MLVRESVPDLVPGRQGRARQAAPILHLRCVANTRSTQAPQRAHDALDRAFDELDAHLPARLGRMIKWLRQPQARWVRLPLGILCIIGSFLWFLPVLGLWFLPLGLLLIAQDVRILRRPVGNMTLYLLDRWDRLRKWWKRRRSRSRTKTV
jgi:hypothetical protein